jgi:hypothetical protein
LYSVYAGNCFLATASAFTAGEPGYRQKLDGKETLMIAEVTTKAAGAQDVTPLRCRPAPTGKASVPCFLVSPTRESEEGCRVGRRRLLLL